MTASISPIHEVATGAILPDADSSEYSLVDKIGRIALKAFLIVSGLAVGSILGFVIAIAFGLVEFTC